MTKDEILKLHTMSESKQITTLYRGGIMKYKYDEFSRTGFLESLADCAFRLRDEFLREETNKYGIDKAFQRWLRLIDSLQDYMGRCEMPYIGIAKPIHWIQAALLAKLEQGE